MARHRSPPSYMVEISTMIGFRLPELVGVSGVGTVSTRHSDMIILPASFPQRCPAGPFPMPSTLAIAAVVSLLLAAYLVVAMLAPEWFA